MKTIKFALIAISLGSATAFSQVTLSLQDYIKQVANQNQSYKASDSLIKSYDLRSGEASLDFMTYLVGNISYSDSRLTPESPFSPVDTINWGGNLGVQTKLRTGTLLDLEYNSNYTSLTGAGSFASAYPPPFYYNNPTLSITQPLWKDFMANLSKSMESSMLADFRSKSLIQKYQQQQISFNAETAYWQMALYKEILDFDRAAVARTEKILSWNKKRVAMNISDRSDLLQAQASMKLKELVLQTDLENQRQVSNQFNSLRNVSGDQVLENLSPIDVVTEKKLLQEIKRTGDRFDLQANIQNEEREKFNSDAAVEKVKPDISLYGNIQTSGLNTNYSNATSGALGINNPLYAIGVKLKVPLDFGLASQINEGNRAAQTAASYTVSRSKFELDQDWNNLQKRFKDVSVRYGMFKELVALQKEKLEHERLRFTQGRTTSFQVLQFEDDYSNAQLSRLRIENDAIVIIAQARLYNGEKL